MQSAPTPSSATSPSTTLTSVSSASPPPRTPRRAPKRTASRSVRCPPPLPRCRHGYLRITADAHDHSSSLPPRPLRHRLRRPQALVAAQVNCSPAVNKPPRRRPSVRNGMEGRRKHDGRWKTSAPPPFLQPPFFLSLGGKGGSLCIARRALLRRVWRSSPPSIRRALLSCIITNASPSNRFFFRFKACFSGWCSVLR